MALERLYRETVRIDIAYPEAFANVYKPTALELNNATLVANLTCAFDEEGTEFTLGDPETDDSLSFCDSAGNNTETFKNPSVNLTYYKDEDRVAAGLYNKARDMLAFKDVPYVAILRVGYRSDVAYANGQPIRLVGGVTDEPVDNNASGENARYTTAFLPDGTVAWNIRVGE